MKTYMVDGYMLEDLYEGYWMEDVYVSPDIDFPVNNRVFTIYPYKSY